MNLPLTHMSFRRMFLHNLESCESDPVFRDSSVSIDVSIIVNAAFLRTVQICFCLPSHFNCTSEGSGTMILVDHKAGREVQRGDGERNHLRCSRNRPCPRSLRVRPSPSTLEGCGWICASESPPASSSSFSKLLIAKRPRYDVSLPVPLIRQHVGMHMFLYCGDLYFLGLESFDTDF